MGKTDGSFTNLLQERMHWLNRKQAQAKVLHFWYRTIYFILFFFHSFILKEWGFLFRNTVKHKQLPAIETVLKATASKRIRGPPVFVLILCPTRELASQIAAEANVLLKYHDGIGVQTLVGGTRFKIDQKRLESDPCQVCLYLCFNFIRLALQLSFDINDPTE